MSVATGPAMSASPNRIIASLFGIVYLLVGLLGFFWVQGIPFAGPGNGSSNLLIGLFEVNPLHNVLHLFIGALLTVTGFASAPAARTANSVVGAAYLLLGIVGFFLAAPDGGHSAANFLALNTPDQILHLGTAVVLLATGLGADRQVRAPAPETAA